MELFCNQRMQVKHINVWFFCLCSFRHTHKHTPDGKKALTSKIKLTVCLVSERRQKCIDVRDAQCLGASHKSFARWFSCYDAYVMNRETYNFGGINYTPVGLVAVGGW